jgi:hypothetical protein
MLSTAEKSTNSTKWFRDIPISIQEYLSIKDTITKECRWYLMGRISERAKLNRRHGETIEQLLARYGQELGYSESTLRRFVKYSISIDYLQTVEPAIASEIISGRLRMSVENLICLANKPCMEIPIIVERVKSGDEKLHEIFPEIAARYAKILAYKQDKNTIGVTVKNTPKYDPDAQVMGLAYTIPSWVNTINRVLISDNVQVVSKTALKKLIKELSVLKEAVELMMIRLSVDNPGKGRA